jgi:hypothetical protein
MNLTRAKKKRRFKRDPMRLNKQRVLFAFDMSLNATGLNSNSFCCVNGK